MKIPIPYEIGFSDGEVRSYHREEDELTVILSTWNNVLLKIKFSDTIGVSDLGVGDVSGVYQESLASPFMEQVIRRLYDAPPPSPPYSLYQFLDLDEQPVLEVVAGSIDISRLDKV